MWSVVTALDDVASEPSQDHAVHHTVYWSQAFFLHSTKTSIKSETETGTRMEINDVTPHTLLYTVDLLGTEQQKKKKKSGLRPARLAVRWVGRLV